MRYLLSAIVGAFLLVLAACGQAPTGAAQPTRPAAPIQTSAPTQLPAPTTTATQPTQAPAATAPAEPGHADTPQPSGSGNEVVVIFHRSGGIAGITETLTVYTDGRLELSGAIGEDVAQADPAQLAALQKLLSSPEFAALNANYQAMGADLFSYEITVPADGKTQIVVTMDGAQNPPILDQVLEQLEQLREQIGNT